MLSDDELKKLAAGLRSMYPAEVGQLRDGDTNKYAKFRHDPVGYIERVLRAKLTPQQKDICNALMQPPHRVIVVSANNTGKSFLSGALVNWFYDCYNPGVCITTAPCFDDTTEILTDSGWKLFKDLNAIDKVASLVDGRLEFVTPTDYIVEPYNGEMVGYKGRDVD